MCWKEVVKKKTVIKQIIKGTENSEKKMWSLVWLLEGNGEKESCD